MAGKPKKSKKLDGAGSKRDRTGSESSTSSEPSFNDTSKEVAMALSAPRATRASARVCQAKMRNNSIMEAVMKAEDKTKRRTIDFDFDKLRSNSCYDQPSLYRKMQPEEFTMDYYHKSGLDEVLIFDCNPTKLGMKMVDDQFTVRDVERLVGGDKMITVVEVESQGSVDMPLKQFINYYYTPKEEKKTLYNVLSLEFSNTALTDHVRSPQLVRDIDWASLWPDERKTRTISFDKIGYFTTTNNYPRVENYCLMSPTECYTDFHIDFHGTSVWYHVKKGMKIFWIIEPTEQNLMMYEEYLKTPDSSAFFGDIVEKCARVEVRPGNTLIIPSGWIHAVYTPEDSLVFGGNFLHSMQILMQLNVLLGEKRIGINKKYRYPLSEEVVWFVINHIVQSVTGRQYIRPASRNQQDQYMEYVGDLFIARSMHQRVPTKENYDDDGIVWEPQWDETDEYSRWLKKMERFEKKKEERNDALNENGMEEAEKSSSASSSLKKVKDPNVEDEMEDEEEEEKEENENENEEMPIFGGHDDWFPDETTFFHPESFGLDAGVGATAVHTFPLSDREPAIRIDRDRLREIIYPEMINQFETLVMHYLKKARVDLPIGLTRPNSLLQTFCELLRQRRQMAEEEKGLTLPVSILPDREGSLRLHQAQVAAREERKRKKEEKRVKEETGEADQDSDYDPDKPRKKKGRKSGEEVRKVGTPRKEEIGDDEQGRAQQKKNWNGPFYLWYSEQHALRAEHKNLGKDAREHIRKNYYTPLSKEVKAIWQARYEEKYKRENPSSSSDIPRPSADPLTDGCMDEVAGPSTVPSAAQSTGNTTMDKNTPAEEHREAREKLGTAVHDAQIKRRPIIETAHLQRLSESKTSTAAQLMASQQLPSRANVSVVPSPRLIGGVQLTHASDNDVLKAMRLKFASEGRLNGAPVTAPQLIQTSAHDTKITDDVSLFIVDTLLSKNPLFPELPDVISKIPLSDPKENEKLEIAKDRLVRTVNDSFNKKLTFQLIMDHIHHLKKLALDRAHASGDTQFLQSTKKVANALLISFDEIPTVQRVSSNSSSLISVKPVEKVLLNTQPVVCSSKVISSMARGVDTSAVIGVKEVKYSTEKKEIKDEEETRNEKEEEKGKEVQETENGDKNGKNQSGFREDRAEPKPPEQEERRKIVSSRTLPLPSASTFTPSEKEEKDTVRRSGRRDKSTILEDKNRIVQSTICANESTVVKTNRKPDKKKDKPVSPSHSIVSLVEVKKEDDDTEDGFGSNDESTGSSRKMQKENHWSVLKKAQEKVCVRRYTTKSVDWTPFDAYLRRHYASWCTELGLTASNATALKIKRDYWEPLAKEGQTKRWESDAERFRAERRERIYWRSDTVVEQEDRVVEDSGLKIVPLGGEEKSQLGRPQYESESSESKPEIKNEDEYLIEEEEPVIVDPEEKEEEMIDVEGMEDDPPFTVQFSSLAGGDAQKIEVKEEMTSLVEGTPKKKVKETKVGRGVKKEPVEKKKRPMRGDNEDFMQTGNTPRSKGKKAKPDPNKPLIVDGVPVNPLAEPAVANAYGYDPAKDIVPLGQGQLKSAYRRSKNQLDTPQIDAKRYKLEVKHDHLLDDNDHDDTHRDDPPEGGESGRPTTPHGGMEMMEGVNVYTGDHSIGGPSPSPGGSSGHNQSHFTPHTHHQRSASFTRRPSQPQPAPLIPHAPSPLSGRRISSAATDGWAAMSSSGRRRSDGGDRRQSGGRSSPPRKMSHYSSGDVPPLTPSTPSTSSTTPVSAPVTTPTAPSPITPKPTRLSQAEQFTMAAPKVIEAPRLATPLVTATPSNSDPSLISRSQSMSGDEPLPADVFCAQMERVIADLERANAVLASNPNNGN